MDPNYVQDIHNKYSIYGDDELNKRLEYLNMIETEFYRTKKPDDKKLLLSAMDIIENELDKLSQTLDKPIEDIQPKEENLTKRPDKFEKEAEKPILTDTIDIFNKPKHTPNVDLTDRKIDSILDHKHTQQIKETEKVEIPPAARRNLDEHGFSKYSVDENGILYTKTGKPIKYNKKNNALIVHDDGKRKWVSKTKAVKMYN